MTGTSSPCQICGVPQDAGFFDASSIRQAPSPGAEIVLAHYTLHRNYCGMLLYFAQFTAAYARDSAAVETPELLWQIRCDGQPRDPYLKFDRIINPWGMAGFPIGLRLEQGCTLELAVRNVSAQQDLGKVGGRLLGRYWYNAAHGGVSGRL